jgi:hypothetical protein
MAQINEEKYKKYDKKYLILNVYFGNPGCCLDGGDWHRVAKQCSFGDDPGNRAIVDRTPQSLRQKQTNLYVFLIFCRNQSPLFFKTP